MLSSVRATKEEEDTQREAERKKPKINDFNPDLVIPGHITPRPSSNAVRATVGSANG